jgi:hypothetical protein
MGISHSREYEEEIHQLEFFFFYSNTWDQIQKHSSIDYLSPLTTHPKVQWHSKHLIRMDTYQKTSYRNGFEHIMQENQICYSIPNIE